MVGRRKSFVWFYWLIQEKFVELGSRAFLLFEMWWCYIRFIDACLKEKEDGQVIKTHYVCITMRVDRGKSIWRRLN